MATILKEPVRTRAAAVRAAMPARMRALYVTTPVRTGGWLAEALAADSASDVQFEEAIGTAAALARLRDEVFDLVLVSHEPGELDALELIEGFRAGGNDEPILVLGEASQQELEALCYEVGADAYLCVNNTTTRTLLWAAARAIERHELLRENRRLLQTDRARLQQEQIEADRLLSEQRALLSELDALGGAHDRNVEIPNPEENAEPQAPLDLLRLPRNLADHYRELLRAYVIMGSGNLSGDMHELAKLLVGIGITPQQTMLLHLQVLEELVRGLGSRSARHVMTRADLLVLELMIHLAEGYRAKYLERLLPLRQLSLPGFDMSAAAA
jgi:DNA-binding response OmpR family regulator